MKTKNLALFTFGLMGFAILGAGSTEDSGPSENSNINLNAAEYTVNYKSLADEFEANSVAAESKYEGRVIHVQGPIHSIDKDFSDTPYISLSGEYDLAIIRCEIGKDAAGIQNLRKGQFITVGGVVGDTTMGVSLEPCRVISTNTSNALPTPPSELEQLKGEIDSEITRSGQELEAEINRMEQELNTNLNTTQ